VLDFAARAGVHPQEILLAALGQALEGWTGAPEMLVDLEGHGREPLFDDVDVSRTVGWFTSLVPLHCRWTAGADPRARLDAVKAQVRALPVRGIGFGLLRYMDDAGQAAAALAANPRPQLTFLYTGETSAPDEGGLLSPAPEPCGVARHPANPRSHLLDVSARIDSGRIVVDWRYGAMHHEATISGLGEAVLAALAAYAGLEPAAGGVDAHHDRSADFGWSAEDVDRIRAALSLAL
jgi:non-ribosomal peptide synthase protein (TIGR01720 family)